MRNVWWWIPVLWLGCGDVPDTSLDASTGADAGATADAGAVISDGSTGETGDAATGDAAAPDADTTGDGSMSSRCEPQSSDYRPRESNSADDTWPACITDDATSYPRIQTSISTIGRVAAFDALFAPDALATRGLLYGAERDPTSEEFLEARAEYQVDNGLESRVGRRPDEHFVAVETPASCLAASACQCPEVAASNPLYCTGPALLQPIILNALNAGIMGGAESSRVYAARAEAALVWMLYLSSYKESGSCADVARDCDSAWAYYTGGAERSDGVGLARLVLNAEPETHQRIWDGLLAVRCWRDLDSAEQASMPELQARARAQQDRALIRGVTAVLLERLDAFEMSAGAERQAHLAFLRTILAPIDAHTISDGEGGTLDVAATPSLFDRTLRELDSAAADFVVSEIAKDAAEIDTMALASRLENAIPCP